MSSINMIALKRAEKRRLENDMRRLAFGLLSVLALAIVVGGWMATSFFATKNRIADMDVQISKLQPVVSEIAKYDKATEKIKPKLDLLNTAKEHTMCWYSTFDALTQSLPQTTYLTRIATVTPKPDDKGISLTLAGISGSQAKVGETMMRLSAIPDFSGVELHYTQQSNGTDKMGVEFEIGAILTNSQSAKGDAQDGKTKPQS